jgi:hypothetical protein
MTVAKPALWGAMRTPMLHIRTPHDIDQISVFGGGVTPEGIEWETCGSDLLSIRLVESSNAWPLHVVARFESRGPVNDTRTFVLPVTITRVADDYDDTGLRWRSESCRLTTSTNIEDVLPRDRTLSSTKQQHHHPGYARSYTPIEVQQVCSFYGSDSLQLWRITNPDVTASPPLLFLPRYLHSPAQTSVPVVHALMRLRAGEAIQWIRRAARELSRGDIFDVDGRRIRLRTKRNGVPLSPDYCYCGYNALCYDNNKTNAFDAEHLDGQFATLANTHNHESIPLQWDRPRRTSALGGSMIRFDSIPIIFLAVTLFMASVISCSFGVVGSIANNQRRILRDTVDADRLLDGLS